MLLQKLKLGTFFILGLSLFSGCIIDINDDDDGLLGCTRGGGDIISRELILDEFDGIELNLPAKVILTQGEEQRVLVEGYENIIERLELDVSDDLWVIETRRCVRDIDDLTIFITLPEFEELRVAGSGEILSETILEVDDLELYIAGSGDIDLGLNADDIDAKIAGSGNIYLEGSADRVDIDVSGSGSVKAFDLTCDRADIRIVGSGDVEVKVNTEMDVRIAGSGSVYYRGNPVIDVTITGSGNVIDAN